MNENGFEDIDRFHLEPSHLKINNMKNINNNNMY